ncbi:MAG TPA: phage tail sheath subtilisin-like domain-containing protein [Paludibaculum sp.]|jgi:hypothetical protein
MPDYIAPGVFVEDPGPAPRPIEDVSTATAAMAGETERGPLEPQLITDWQQFTLTYGDFLDRTLPPPTPNIYLPYGVRGFFENGGRRLYVARVSGTGATIAQGALPGVGGDTIVAACGPGGSGNRIVVLVQPDSENPERFALQALYFRDGIPPNGPADRVPDAQEEFRGLTAASAATTVNAASRLVRIVDCPAPPAASAWPGIVLEGGSSAPATAAEYGAALAALCDIEEPGLLAIPDEAAIPSLGEALIDQCERLRDRFAVLSEPADQRDVSQIRPARDTSYAAWYYPKLRVPAPHTPGGQILVPACGHVLGLIARMELGRGVAKAPANEVLHGLIESDPVQLALGKSEQDSLNTRGVNVIRDFRSTGRGVRVWGARTMSSDPQWRYINVRRLCIFLERSIAKGTEWVVFEPNSEPTWSAVRASVEFYLGMVWRDGALLGNKESQAFFVRCDRTTMTQADIDSGRLICEIGVAPVKLAEFVIIRIGQWTMEAG